MGSMSKQLIKRAVILFPRTCYTESSAVRHNRRQYLAAIAFMRSYPQSRWVLDHKAERVQ